MNDVKSLLITGGAGFIGSNFVLWMLEQHPEIAIVNLDALTYAGHLDHLIGAEKSPNYTFVHGDIRDRELVAALFARYRFDAVVHLAAESHVDRSIAGPEVFVQTNVVGTQVLLDAAVEYPCRFVQASTDEVYGALGATGLFTEDSPLCPSSPYSASKAAADLLCLAYHKTFGLDVVITRSSNNFGPRQHAEKLIPGMLLRCLRDEPLPVYGSGDQVRDWLYVEDNCAGLDAALGKGQSGESYNLGGGCERTNLEVVGLLLAATGRDSRLIRHVADRPGHDFRYALDCEKSRRALGWQAQVPFAEGLARTVRWYQEGDVGGLTKI